MSSKGVWGIDMGDFALKALRLEVDDDEITATDFAYIERTQILSLSGERADVVSAILNRFMAEHDLRGDTVVVGVPGQSSVIKAVTLRDVVKKDIAACMRYEAKQQIPFDLDDQNWDYQMLGDQPAGRVSQEIEVSLVAAKRETVEQAILPLRKARIKVKVVQAAPLALANFAARELLGKLAGKKKDLQGKKRCFALLDMGAHGTNLVILDGKRLFWQRMIPSGGDAFTRAISRELKLTVPRAEHLKCRGAQSPDLKKVLQAVKPALQDFVAEIQRSLSYFHNIHRDARIESLVGVGNGWRLPGLHRYVSEKLDLEVKKFSELEHLNGADVVGQTAFADNLAAFAVAYGLALQGAGLSMFRINLATPPGPGVVVKFWRSLLARLRSLRPRKPVASPAPAARSAAEPTKSPSPAPAARSAADPTELPAPTVAPRREVQQESHSPQPRRLIQCPHCGQAFENRGDKDSGAAAIRGMLSAMGGDENVGASFGLDATVFSCPHCQKSFKM